MVKRLLSLAASIVFASCIYGSNAPVITDSQLGKAWTTASGGNILSLPLLGTYNGTTPFAITLDSNGELQVSLAQYAGTPAPVIVDRALGKAWITVNGGNIQAAPMLGVYNGTTLLPISVDQYGNVQTSGGGGGGTVSSVGLSLPNIFTVTGSPVTTTGTLTGSLNTQTKNLVFAGPASGSAAAPTFRSLAGADLPFPGAISLGGTESIAPSTSNWIDSISTSGVPHLSQPAFTDISGSVAASQLPNPTATTLGGIESAAAVSNQWIDSISTSGVPHLSQPAFTNISGSLAGSQLPTFTGDVTNSGAAVTIANNAVSNAKLAQMAAHTYKGNNTGSTANAADITSTQLTADLNLFSSSLQGLVPASGGGTTNFLRADGNFAAPPTTSPGGSNPQVQFNDGGSFNGDANFTWDKANHRLGVGNAVTPVSTIHIDALQTNAAPNMLQLTHGTNTGTGATNGVFMGYDSASSGHFVLEYNGSSSFNIQMGSSQDVFVSHVGGTTTMSDGGGHHTMTFDSPGVGIDSSPISSFMDVGGSFGAIRTGLSANTTLSNAYFDVNVSASGANRTISLPHISSGAVPAYNRLYYISKSDTTANTVTISPFTSETINGSTTLTPLGSVFDGVLIHANQSGDSNDWKIIADNRAPLVFTKTSNYTVTTDSKDITVLCDATVGNVTVSGYALAGHSGWKVTLKKIDSSGNSCIYTAASGAGDGASVTITTQNQSRIMQEDGTNTQIIGGYL